MLYSKYKDFLTLLKDKKILITTHNLVDIDGLASCFSLKFLLNRVFDNPIVSVFFSELSKPTKDFMLRFKEKYPNFNFNFDMEVEFSKFEICVILDTSNLSQIRFNKNDMFELKIPYIFIDHHLLTTNQKEENIDHVNLIKDNASSTTEIILELFEYLNQNLPPPFRSLMLAAILTDSGFFKYGNNETVKNVCKLIDSDITIQDVQQLLEQRIDISERIAKIKGLQRVEIIRKGDYLIGVTNVSSFGATVASTLLKAGFDVSIVHTKDKKENIINSRAKKSICLQSGLHLGKIFEKISESCGGSGGGHDGAASLSFDYELEEILSKIIEKIKQFL